MSDKPSHRAPMANQSSPRHEAKVLLLITLCDCESLAHVLVACESCAPTSELADAKLFKHKRERARMRARATCVSMPARVPACGRTCASERLRTCISSNVLVCVRLYVRVACARTHLHVDACRARAQRKSVRRSPHADVHSAGGSRSRFLPTPGAERLWLGLSPTMRSSVRKTEGLASGAGEDAVRFLVEEVRATTVESNSSCDSRHIEFMPEMQ
eukprot:6204502-Pleurochrysis_carterae.AAC.2